MEFLDGSFYHDSNAVMRTVMCYVYPNSHYSLYNSIHPSLYILPLTLYQPYKCLFFQDNNANNCRSQNDLKLLLQDETCLKSDIHIIKYHVKQIKNSTNVENPSLCLSFIIFDLTTFVE